MRKTITKTFLSAGLLLATAPAMAAIITISGDTVDFTYNTDNIDPLFGSLSVVGDTIFATPVDFKAQSNGGAIIVSGTGTITITTKTGYSFKNILAGESGIYNTSGTGTVDVNASLRLSDAANPVFGVSETTNLTVDAPFANTSGSNMDWSANGGFDLTTATWDGLSSVNLRLTNLLTATGGTSGLAYVDKSLVGAVGFTVVTVVPVPAAVWLFGSGLIGLIGLARRKTS